MEENLGSILMEIRDMLKVLTEEQDKLMKSMKELKDEQKRLFDEIRINNFVINNIIPRSETIN